MRFVAKLIVVFAVLSGFAAPAWAESRVALVVGEGGYRSLSPLENPPNDAKDVGDALKALGFDTEVLVDADLATLRRSVAAFAKKAEKSDAAMIYYGGHGLRIMQSNFLVPVDAEFHSAADVTARSYPLDDMMAALSKGTGVKLLFLDACRNNPIKGVDVPGLGQGLAEAQDYQGFFIAYATSPGFVAYDGAGRNSPFAQAFLSHVATPGADVSNLMISVRRDVSVSTGGEQLPWDTSSLTQPFFFAGATGAEVSPEGLLWQAAAKDRDRNLLEIYLDRYPKGPHSNDARALVGQFTPATASRRSASEVEADLWRLTLSSRQRSLAELYLARYPEGSHAKDAKALLSSLEAADAAANNPAATCERLATVPADATAVAAGVDFSTLAAHASTALDACRAAVEKQPEIAHYQALLARTLYASGQYDEAISFYRKAADGGDARAMVSLGLLMEAGDHVGKDIKGAYALYGKAAERGSADGAINLGFALAQGQFVDKDVPRAYALFKKASDAGSARATYDLATLVESGVGGNPADALALFKLAASQGEPAAHRAAAVLLDEGRSGPRDPKSAAHELLACVGADSGACYNELVAKSQSWSLDTVKGVQALLKAANYYSGPIDGRAGPTLAPALKQWRLLGGPTG